MKSAIPNLRNGLISSSCKLDCEYQGLETDTYCRFNDKTIPLWDCFILYAKDKSTFIFGGDERRCLDASESPKPVDCTEGAKMDNEIQSCVKFIWAMKKTRTILKDGCLLTRR